MPAAPVGLLSVTRDVAGAWRLTQAIAASHPGLRPRFVGLAEMSTIEPSIAPGIAACRLDIGYPVAPAAATLAYAARAERAGVEIRVGAGANLSRTGDRVTGVVIDGRSVPAPDVLVAAGPWTPAIVDPSGAWSPIVARWGVVVEVRLDGPPAHVLEEADISIEPGAEEDAEAGHAFSLVTADGAQLARLHVPRRRAGSGRDSSRHWCGVVRGSCRPSPRRRSGFPVCARPLSRDGRPLIGRVPGVEGPWVAAGHGPWGISTGPSSGRLIADLIDGRVAAPPAALDPARFGAPPA